MDQKLKRMLFLFITLFLAKIAIADPMRDMGAKKRPQYISSNQLGD